MTDRVIEKVSDAIVEWRLGQVGEFAALERIDRLIHDVGPEREGTARVDAATLHRALYECYMLSGADTSADARHGGVCATVDDHEWWRLNPSEAVEAVRELREQEGAR